MNSPKLIAAATFCVAVVLSGASPDVRAADADITARVTRVLDSTPLIDGHNDLPWGIREITHNNFSAIDIGKDTSGIATSPGWPNLTTDIPRLRKGMVGAQFWSVYVPVSVKGFEVVQTTMEQIDLVKRMAARYPAALEMAYTAADIRRIHKQHKIASLVGIEGGHQINNSLAVLRQMYALGARYMTLTHSSNNEWADSATDTPLHHGLTPFGENIVREMNRIGMLVDLSHVSPDVMRQALKIAVAPVMFSHSSARALVDHPRNVPDDILRLVAANGGVVMVNFNPGYVSDAQLHWDADLAGEQARYDTPPFGGLYIGQPERAKAALDAWQQAHPRPIVTLAMIADHIDHIRQVAGVDHVGLGSDFDGIPFLPQGLEGVEHFPALMAELMRRGWSDADVAKVAGENMLRVLAGAEAVSAKLSASRPALDISSHKTNGR
jgi:membrane dipeptidase